MDFGRIALRLGDQRAPAPRCRAVTGVVRCL
ncbi:MAG: hypothetical protein JWQ73_406, partial [Variovorax sp.]|nr:hypothetical protein [Variovorax sp.]